MKYYAQNKGFTLVELAIVMIIIGLLIGGVIKGQELIKNAQVAAAVSEMKSFDAAINGVYSVYKEYPGDMMDPAGRIANCSAAPCNRPGNGNDRIGADGIYTVTADDSENLSAWAQMKSAGMITVVDGSATLVYGNGLPQSAFGVGGYQISYHPGGLVRGNALSEGHFLQLGLTVAEASSAGARFLQANVAARMDRKIDDGVSDTGSVREASGTCDTGTAGVYDESSTTAICTLVVGLSN